MAILTRPPVIAVLGHVDHGKTTLLDYIRKANVAGGEHGGITQHIGAYEITHADKKITFIDTPGHEAFTNLRKRGVEIADVALLVVAADSSVQPQTKEAISVIQESGIPYIVVVNKIDLPDIMLEKIFKDLGRNNVFLEGRGGNVPHVEVSAKTGQGVDTLLDLISLMSELKELTYDDASSPLGGVVESKKDRRGVIATVILKNGQIKVGQDIYIGTEKVRVRALIGASGEQLKVLLPSTPAEVLGGTNSSAPGAVVSDKPQARLESSSASSADPMAEFRNEFFKSDKKQFNFIIKVDAVGSKEVLEQKLGELEEIRIIKSEVGEPTESDIEQAVTSKASILAFNVKVRPDIERKAEFEGVSVFSYKIIYELLDQMEELIYHLRVTEEKEARKNGEAKILAEFVKGPVKIAGMRIMSGKIKVGFKAEITRGKKNLGETTIKSLYSKSVPVLEMKKGEECGAIFEPPLDFKQGDIVKLYIP